MIIKGDVKKFASPFLSSLRIKYFFYLLSKLFGYKEGVKEGVTEINFLVHNNFQKYCKF